MSEINREVINSVLMGIEDSQIRFLFVEKYSSQLELFVDHMVEAFSEWSDLDTRISKDLAGAHLSALIYGALHTHVVAMKLLLCGLLVPSGNSQRYVLESIATALLASKPSLGFLNRYMEGKYSTTKAVRDVQRNAKALQLEQSALAILDSQSKLYDLSSHPTIFSSASLITLNQDKPLLVLGGSFDEGKSFAYEKEIASRVSLAATFQNFIYGVRRNYCEQT